MAAFDTFDLSPSDFESIDSDAGPVIDLFDFRVLALAPTVTVISPATSAPPVGGVFPNTPIVLDISNEKNDPIQVLTARFSVRGMEEVIHDAEAFTSQYNGRSTREPILIGVGGGFRYTIYRNGGWFENPEIVTYPLLHVEGE